MQFLETFVQLLRWTARVVGTLILAFVLLNLISGGLPNVANIAPGEWLLWGGFVLSLVGYVLLWKWELIGGIVALGGIVLFYAVNFALSRKFPGGWVIPLFFLPGFLSIVCWLTECRATSSLRQER